MLNVTSRLAISIRNIPDGVNWADSTPQGRRGNLTVDDILPSEQDAGILRKRAARYLTDFLVSEFCGLKDLRQYVSPLHPSSPVTKMTVVPMKILFNSETYAAENVAILRELVKDADLQGRDEVHRFVLYVYFQFSVLGKCKISRSMHIGGADILMAQPLSIRI